MTMVQLIENRELRQDPRAHVRTTGCVRTVNESLDLIGNPLEFLLSVEI